MKNFNRGFTLIDTVVALFVSSLLLAIVTTSFPNYNRLLNKLQARLGFQEQYILFFLQLEDDFFASALDYQSKIKIAKNLQFKRWEWSYNTNDFHEKTTSYHYKKSTKEISKKLNNENRFTSILKQVSEFTYKVIDNSDTFCLKITTQNIFDKIARKQVFCRHF